MTPPQYDPQKANAWTRDLPAKPPIKERPEWITISTLLNGLRLALTARFVIGGNRYGKTLLRDFEALQSAARAVIAAGRPHLMVGRFDVPQVPCQCPQCAAYDALKTLLEP